MLLGIFRLNKVCFVKLSQASLIKTSTTTMMYDFFHKSVNITHFFRIGKVSFVKLSNLINQVPRPVHYGTQLLPSVFFSHKTLVTCARLFTK